MFDLSYFTKMIYIKFHQFQFENQSASTLVNDPETGSIQKTKNRNYGFMTSRIFMQAFTMTFLAEWGDRSQLTTIILGKLIFTILLYGSHNLRQIVS